MRNTTVVADNGDTTTLDLQELLTVLRAVKKGDFSVRMPDDRTGIAGKICDTLNEIVEADSAFWNELARIGKSSAHGEVITDHMVDNGALGKWSAPVRSINKVITGMVESEEEIARTLNAVAKGTFTMPEEINVSGQRLSGGYARIAEIIQNMVQQLNAIASEVDEVAKAISVDGKLNRKVSVKGFEGAWLGMANSINNMVETRAKQSYNIMEIVTAIADGDLTRKITVDAKGEILELKNTVNSMVDKLNGVVSEVTKTAQEVGTEGKLGGHAQFEGIGGSWKELVDSVNLMVTNLTGQMRDISKVATGVANGDLSTKITVNAMGEIADLKNAVNSMVDQLTEISTEISRVSREVAVEGKLGAQAKGARSSGTWRELTEGVNLMISSLAKQLRDASTVTAAVANGDLSTKITVDVKGEMLELKNTINMMVEQLGTFASEVTRVTREVGTDGRLGGQAKVEGVAGVWKDLTDGVNTMAGNLTDQMRDISKVATAVVNGDLSAKITVSTKGEITELKDAINRMLEQLGAVSSEITRVSREVGMEGKLGAQAHVVGIGGIWQELIDGVNLMVGNLADQMRDASRVTAAVARGDLSTKIGVDVKGEMLELKNTVNMMVDQLGIFASEVTRVAREVGTDGRLGGQAKVENVAGIWKDLTDNVNIMAGNLTEQMRDISKVAAAVADGDLSTKISVDAKGEISELKNTINRMVDQLSIFASEVTRITREVGTDGRLGGQARVDNVGGIWKSLTNNVNLMVNNLTDQMRDISKVAAAVADGDLSTKISVNARGEISELKNTINRMVDQLSSFSSEVTRVAREVGIEGKLGAQAQVIGAGGMWRDLTNNVNMLAANITRQVRDIAKVVTAIAKGNLKKKMTVEAEGELAALTETIDNMIDTLASFADQVTNVAREVGVEGKLGAQANVPGADGIWKSLTDNVNILAANLTTQVRAINSVATAVAKGDLSHSVTVEAVGEVAVLKDNVNEMIVNLTETTKKNNEQDWLNTNLARFNRLLQGQRDLPQVCRLILSELAPLVQMQHGALYICETDDNEEILKLYASYGFQQRKHLAVRFKTEEGLLGQCMLEKQRIMLTDVPGDYVKINSALGEAAPMNIVIIPVLFEGNVLAALEIASFHYFNNLYLDFLDQLAESVGIVINTVHANMRTEELLKQSQSLTEELQQQQEELTQTNEELEEKANLLVDQKAEVERKNQEVEQAKQVVEEKAEQLAVTSKYKSEFLANMSHELRTPLNSLLVLAQQLSENAEGNLTEKQVEFAGIICDSGKDLLSLINDILDLSKIESGTTTPNFENVPMVEIQENMERTFRHMAEKKKLTFAVQAASDIPKIINTDKKRILQILKNLLSNAFKFTAEGSVTLAIEMAADGWLAGNTLLDDADGVVAFAVTDTGIGIPEDKQRVIFEAFQQADGSTSRKYGGTGLGLAISREIAQILGGEISLRSAEGQGSTFTLYLPVSSTLSEPEEHADTPPVKPVREARAKQRISGAGAAGFADDRETVQPGDKTLLIIEDDAVFAGILTDMARARGFKGIVSLRGGDAVELARQYMPSAIILDLRLPDIDGWTILNRIRGDIDIRHIPIHIISAEDERIRGLQKGALTYLNKPVSNDELEKTFDSIKSQLNVSIQNLLIVSGNQKQWDAKKVLDGINVKITSRSSGKNAIALLKKQPVDCIILDAKLSDMTAAQFVSELQNEPFAAEIPVIVYAREGMNQEQESKLNELAKVTVLREVESSERLIDEVTLFLHKVVDALPDAKQSIIRKIYQSDDVLMGKKILIVDDDMRNIFALTSVLEQHSVDVSSAENGRDAIKVLKANPDTQIILMDIMMPEMDGYETMRAIKKIPKFKDLPIIALTAKAMKGDREKCIEAGASDYITKPIDTEQLLSLLRVWLYK